MNGAARVAYDTLVGGLGSQSTDQRMRDVVQSAGSKRPIFQAQDIAEAMMMSVSGKRFRGDAAVAPMRSALPQQLARGLNVVNTGFSTTDAQTDEVITQCIFARPFPERWEQGFCEQTALFASAAEKMFGIPNVHTVADVPTLNYLLELGDLTDKGTAQNNAYEVRSELDRLAGRYDDLVARTAGEFSEKWNFLGPMTTVLDNAPHSSFESVRRAHGSERMLGYSIFNRARTFNLFDEHIKSGDQLFFVCKEVDLYDPQQFLDPRGNPIVTRTAYPSRALQVQGLAESGSSFAAHNTNTDDSIEPAARDLDYMQRQARIKNEFRSYDFDPDTESMRLVTNPDDVQELMESVPETVYDAYMCGSVVRVGVARSKEGRAPSAMQIREAHRSQEKMKLLQTVNLWRGL